jgi:L-threonylcarbamoyladenylate synthase
LAVTSPNRSCATQILPYGPVAIARAAELIRDGEPVAVPTETVYGLAADATNPEAVASIYRAKGRPDHNPLIVHVSGLQEAERFGTLGENGRLLAATWWPGALTLVVPKRAGAPLAEAVTASLPTIALRCPDHPVMRDLLVATGRPLAAPSANASGSVSPTSAAHVLASLGGRIPLIVDGGATRLGLESTIVAVEPGGVRLLRPGPVPLEDLVAVAGLAPSSGSARIEAPGQLASHYAPAKPLRLNADRAEAGEWLIGFGGIGGDDNLSPAGDLREAAASLFAALHRADGMPHARIAVAPMPDRGIGAAINDRLRRAAAPRP